MAVDKSPDCVYDITLQHSENREQEMDFINKKQKERRAKLNTWFAEAGQTNKLKIQTKNATYHRRSGVDQTDLKTGYRARRRAQTDQRR